MKNLTELYKKSQNQVSPIGKDHKEEYWSLFEKTGIPTKKWENWKYTPLTRVDKIDFNLEQGQSQKYQENLDSQFTEIHIINGHLASKQINISGVDFCSLSTALSEKKITLEKLKSLENKDHPFYQLNQVFLQDGVFLNIKSQENINKPIKIVYSNTENQNPMCHPQVIVSVEKNSKCTIWEDFSSLEGKRWTNSLTKFFIQENAKLTHIKSVETKEDNWHLDQSLVDVRENSHYDSTVFYKDEGLSRNEILVTLHGKESHATLNGLYLPKGNGHSDHYTKVIHQSPLSFSKQLYKGIIEDESMAVFSGQVIVSKNCPGVDSTQLNKNLLLSPKARIESQPQLLISTDDVKCAHGSTTGQISKEELFYLQARGIPACQAYEMLATAFAEDIILSIENKHISAQLKESLIINSQDQMESLHV